MNVREKVMSNKPVRVRPLAEEAGISASGLYNLVKKGQVESIIIGRSVVIPPRAARPLLGIAEPAEPVAA